MVDKLCISGLLTEFFTFTRLSVEMMCGRRQKILSLLD